MGKVSGKTSVSLKDFLAARGELTEECLQSSGRALGHLHGF
jgi:hypothetical protein